MELRHLRCFLAVAEELHFARAAEKLHIETSPLSRAIKELEEELGVVLFARTTRSTRLTRAGKLFLEHVRRVFKALEQARDSVKAAANGFHGQLRVALSDGITPSRLPALLALCRQEEPEVEIRFFEVPLSQQIKGLHDDLYDVGFTQSDEVGDGITAIPAWSDPIVVAVPARHPVLAHKRIPLDELLRYPLVLCDPQVCEGPAKHVDRILRRVEMEPLVAERVASCDLMMALVPAAVLQSRSFAMSATKKLRLGPLPKTENVKLTFVCPISLKADLDRYASLHAQAYGEAVDAEKLIPHMLEAFIAGDRGFKKLDKVKTTLPKSG